ncbi:hypothetical protein A3SI_13153 [Nitritalea halalkaliphila LW7]|uniref:Lipoprotein n=1 Tax=Nitritalea halalkaliphila LW7 TaxID=1189621 RepID=I5C185_9BACT|nr:hypothetical protein [Nitritalea halalkaliphila]EIM75587.1 hypothetical protein A3SI_13153 [Nitritalea halalkaliphila LW7]
MKKLYVLFILLLAFGCSQVEEIAQDKEKELNPIDFETVEGQPFGARILEVNDPNSDPSWDWTEVGNWNLFVRPATPGQNAIQVQTTSPFFEQGNPLNTVNKDMYPEDGWVLVARDFGTPNNPVQTPFYALYNKYQGRFRILFYTNELGASGMVRVGLALNSSGTPKSFLSFNDFSENGPFLDVANPDLSLSAITGVQVTGGWGSVDFNLSSYDNAALNWEDQLNIFIWSMDATTLDAEPFGDFVWSSRLQPISTHPALVNPFFSSNQIHAPSIASIRERLGQEGFATVGSSNPGSSSADVFMQELAALNENFQGYIGAPLSVSGRHTLYMRDLFRFTVSPLDFQPQRGFTISLSAKDFQANGSSYKPLSTIPWGIFAFQTMPELVTETVYERRIVEGSCQLTFESTLRFDKPIAFLQREASALGMRLKSAKFNLGPDKTDKAEFPFDLLTFEGVSVSGNLAANAEQVARDMAPDEIRVQLIYEIEQPTRYAEPEIVIYRTLPVRSKAEVKALAGDCP